ncbi:hypothetical protein CDD82_3185 [Ophiocordyceps australis]|uniref:ASX DEUBAD domain-containing protein n=1 Tax=Ophiocordyceps australis TaxID=1399860 RepID=A0A2C5ZE34_9HYPO|nr:hypothetical protein CDD82_3185 [Ophiocordyceps australis]
MPANNKNKVPKKPRGQRSKQSLKRLLTSAKSPLASADLRTILCNELAWKCLDRSDKQQILSLLPDQRHILDADTPDARPNLASLQSDDSFRDDCAAYVENLAAGRHDEGWLADAWTAHQRRKAGLFEAHLHERFLRDWAVELSHQELDKVSHLSPSESAKTPEQSLGEPRIPEMPRQDPTETPQVSTGEATKSCSQEKTVSSP